MACFVVHEHHAKKLHYDLRLEIKGILKSWAVPKGPSMSPKDKRLAIMVDDHPLEYANYEGIIPKKNYGAGPVIIWDCGEFEIIKGSLKEGMIEFYLNGKKLKGLFLLIKIKTKKDQWLLIKKKDKYSIENFKITQELTIEKLKYLKEKIPPML